MGISKFLGVGAQVEVKASNLKPRGPLQAHFGNTYATAKVTGLIVVQGIFDSGNKLVKVQCSSPAFKSGVEGNEVVFECKAGCCKVQTPASEDLRFEV